MRKTQHINAEPSLDAQIVARMADLHVQTVLAHIRRGNLKASRATGYRIKPEDVREFIRQLPELSRPGRRKKAAANP